ncbi:MAG: hypothetical protein AAB468_02240 [Patescibacteria group bacterium]|mgnify:FL=1
MIRCKWYFAWLAILTLALMPTVEAYVAGSSSYRLQSDSINFGGVLSTSTLYKIEDTAGEIATGDSASTNYKIKAGYQQMVSPYLSVSAPADVAMSPAVSGITGGASAGTATWTVVTDNAAGYSMSVVSSGPLASGVYAFDDYSGSPDYDWTILSTAAKFGFTPEGTDIVQRYKDNGSSCNAGSSNSASTCWDGFSQSARTVAQSTAANQPTGTDTTIRLRAEIGSQKQLEPRTYTTTITITVVTL